VNPTADNLYVHFPFCRRKCTYCALHSRVGVTAERRAEYVRQMADALDTRLTAPDGGFKTVYFGGGSPALCDLTPLLKSLAAKLATDCEFTVELHPLDVTDELLAQLRDGGVNRISMGVQSLDDETLADMGRGYTVSEAARAFETVKCYFDNAGIDLIVGYPNARESCIASLAAWGLAHCSVYSLILEEKSILAHRKSLSLPTDDEVMDELRGVSAALAELDLKRYEISNYALPGRECRHNLAVWRGEDYIGLGEGAYGRLGLYRTRNWLGEDLKSHADTEKVDASADRKERTLFRLRTCEGIDASQYPDWRPILDRYVEEGILKRGASVATYLLTDRGTEVCDTVLSDLV